MMSERVVNRMLRQNCDLMKVTPKRLDRDDIGRFLVVSLAAELEPELGIVVPTFPISAADVLSNMDSTVDVKNEIWKNRSWRYQIPHPGVVFIGVINAKNSALGEANQIVESGWADDVGNAFIVARAKVRAGQILVDWLHCKERKSSDEFFLGVGFVAGDLITDLCLTAAEENSYTLRHIKVRESAQLSYETVMENLGDVVEISAFGGVLKYKYHLPQPGSLYNMIRGLAKVASGEEEPEDSATGRWLADMPGPEKDIYAFSANDILDELKGMEELNGTRANGNGKADTAKPVESDATSEPVQISPVPEPVSTDEVDPEQAEYERIAAEYEAERLAKEAEQAANTLADEVEEMCAEQADHLAGLAADMAAEAERLARVAEIDAKMHNNDVRRGRSPAE